LAKINTTNNNANASVLLDRNMNDDQVESSRNSNLNSSMQVNSNKSFMSTINDLKKKWNDVSGKNKVSPGANRGNLNDSVLNDSSMRLNEIKSKYQMSRIKNVNLNNVKK
jgi:hypothetical protein